MALCRMIALSTNDVLLRPTAIVFGRIKTKKWTIIPAKSERCFNYEFCASLSSLSNYGKYKEHKRSGWKFYLATAAGLGAATAYVKSYTEDVCCAEIEKSESQGIWKDWKITLYQYQTCPFSTKARTFLYYYQIPCKIVEVHPIFKKEIKFSEKYKKVPIVTIENQNGMHELQDSSLIMSILSTYMTNNGQRSVQEIIKDYPATEIVGEDGKKRQVVMNKYWILKQEPDEAVQFDDDDPRQIEVKWRQWTDDHLVHLISPNVYRTLLESYRAFDHHVKLGRFNGTWDGVVAKYGGAVAMWIIGKKLKKKWCKEDDVRIDLYRACNDWCDALGKKKFMGGEEPNLADLSVYAVLNVMEGLISFEDITTYTRIKPWYYRVQQAVEEKKASISTTVS